MCAAESADVSNSPRMRRKRGRESRAGAAAEPQSLELIGDLGDARLGAGLVAGLARAADPDRADGVVADIDGHAAAERDHVGELALPGEIGTVLGLLRPF